MELSEASTKYSNELLKQYKHWRYKNTGLLLVSVSLFFYFIDSPAIRNSIIALHDLGYFGAFIAGIFFTSTFTIAPAMVVLYNFADVLDPFLVALIAGIGSTLGDYILFRLLRDKIFEELNPLINKIVSARIKKLFLTPYFAWLVPLIGALIIASPFPDEPGIGMLGLTRITLWQFVLCVFLLDFFGILLVVLSSHLF